VNLGKRAMHELLIIWWAYFDINELNIQNVSLLNKCPDAVGGSGLQVAATLMP
jgi:hypothetical protein